MMKSNRGGEKQIFPGEFVIVVVGGMRREKNESERKLGGGREGDWGRTGIGVRDNKAKSKQRP